jgi:peptide/nickel transport system permease protein
MGTYWLMRLGRVLLTMLGIVLLTFVLGRLTGDPVALLLPTTATLDDYNRIRASLGLDQPLPVQFVTYLSNAARGDLGMSILFNRPAFEVVTERIPATLELGVMALVLAVTLGIPLGVVCARRRGSPLDWAVMTLTLAGQSLPGFVIGIFLILFFGVALRWLPTFGRDTPLSIILPAITLMIYPLALIVRLTRSALLDTLSEGYVRTARAKGLSERTVLTVHALRNALIPIVTVIGLQVASILSGAAIVETVFAWPGIGLLAVQSIGARDFPVMQTVVLLSAVAFGVTNILIDIAYTLVDPRIRARAA